MLGYDLHAADNGQAWCHGASDDCITSGHPRSSTHHPPRHSPKLKLSCDACRGWTVMGVSLAGSGWTRLRSRCSYHTHLPPSPRGLIVLTSPKSHMLQLMWAHACGEGIAATTSRRRSGCVQEEPMRVESPGVSPHAAGRGIAQKAFLYTRVQFSFYITHGSSVPRSRPTVSPRTQRSHVSRTKR